MAASKSNKRSADGATRKVDGSVPTVPEFNKGRLGAATKYGIDEMLRGNSAKLEGYRLFIEACKNKEMTPKHAAQVTEYMRAAVLAKRKASGNDTPLPKLSKQEVTHDAAVLKLHTFSCVDDLFAKLKPLDLSRPSIVVVARWIRDKENGVTHAQVKAPTREALLDVVNAGKATKQGKGKGAKARKAKRVVGFPSADPVAGIAHVGKCIKAFVKANPELNASERALTTAMLRNADALVAAAKRVVKVRVDAAAKSDK